jgi:hypothetical protein
LGIAQAVFAALAPTTEATLWTHSVFRPGRYPLEELERQLRRHTFAAIIATPDDELLKRGVLSETLRDNLLIEFGLFAGAMGWRRTFLVCPDETELALPSDLAGLIHARYDERRAARGGADLAAAVEIPCQQIREVIREECEAAQRQQEEAARRFKASQQGQALARLNNAAIHLRETLAAVQRDALSALADATAFQEAKIAAVHSVKEAVGSFIDDADLVGVKAELLNLCDATVAAIQDLPFPQELAVGRQVAERRAIDIGAGALGSWLRGGDPLAHLNRAASAEADSRIGSLKARYAEWWERQTGPLQAATRQLQDRLFQAAIELAMAAQGGLAGGS